MLLLLLLFVNENRGVRTDKWGIQWATWTVSRKYYIYLRFSPEKPYITSDLLFTFACWY